MLFAVAFLVVSAVLAGLVLLRARTSVLAGWFLLGAGFSGLAASWAWRTVDDDVWSATLLVVAVLLLVPLACWAYPAPRWRSSTDVVLAVLLVGPGIVALTDPRDGELVPTMALVSGTALLAQTWWRLERADDADRRALLWFGFATGGSGFAALVLLFLSETSSSWFVAGGVALLAAAPASMAVGALRPDLVDVRGLVVYAVVLAVATSSFLAYYVGTVSALTDIAGEPPAAAVQAIVALVGAAALPPGAHLLRGVIDRLLFGDRPDALHAATRVLDRFGEGSEQALGAIRESLVLPYAQLRVAGEVVATSGSEVASVRSIPLSLADGTEGELVVGLRAGDLRLAAQDEHVLRLVAPLLAQAVRARAMAADLQLSRGQAIAAIEEERRRLRRDLHDGLGPTLSGIAFSADAARNSLRGDPDTADAVLVNLRADAAEAVDAVRRLVYGMRPPALDELGLEGALRHQAATLRRQDGQLLPVRFEAVGELGGLPAAVEVAAYRIVTEALTNVARHAVGTEAEVRLCREQDRLVVEVTDDGAPAGPWRPGVGASSMRERVAEIGGELTWGATPTGGRVLAALPVS